MFTDRARQFLDRHGWPLARDESGGEVDEFDDEWSTYCVVAKGDRHVASARLRPASCGSMLARHFPQFPLVELDRLNESTEITRFCASPSLTTEDRIIAVSDLLLGICRYCQMSGLHSFFGVVFPAVSRVFRLAGWPGNQLAEAQLPGGRGLLQEWHANEVVSWAIQEVRGRREDRLQMSKVARSHMDPSRDDFCLQPRRVA